MPRYISGLFLVLGLFSALLALAQGAARRDPSVIMMGIIFLMFSWVYLQYFKQGETL